MLERHKVDFAKAILFLHAIKQDPARFDLLLEMQRHLIRRIFATEKALKRTRRARGRLRATLSRRRLSRDQANAVRHLVAVADRRLDAHRQLLFYWRTFGDGIASIYQSPYSLKHLFFDENYQVKQDAGFLSGKSGFKREWKMVKLGLKMQVPVVLSDLTNMVRIGDVCALAGADPHPIEIKTGGYRSARRGRQEAHISALLDFYKNDGATSFRGVPNVQRVTLPDGATYESEANACIAECLRNGVGSVEPEPGLRYIVVSTLEAFREHVAPLGIATTLVRSLTPEPNWVPCYPFTLSLEPGNLWSFMNNELTFFVLIDLLHLKKLFAVHGIDATMLMDGQSAIQICHSSRDFAKGVFRISELLFARVWLEFQSLAWFAEVHSNSLYDFEKEATPIDPSDISAMMERGELIDWTLPYWQSWQDAKDCWDVGAQEAQALDQRHRGP